MWGWLAHQPTRRWRWRLTEAVAKQKLALRGGYKERHKEGLGAAHHASLPVNLQTCGGVLGALHDMRAVDRPEILKRTPQVGHANVWRDGRRRCCFNVRAQQRFAAIGITTHGPALAVSKGTPCAVHILRPCSHNSMDKHLPTC